MLDALAHQWQEIGNRVYPETLPAEGARFLEQLDRRVEILIASGDPAITELESSIRAHLPACFDLQILVTPGLEYYPLKNAAADAASGDVLVFLDSDVLPDPGWMAHLLGSFARDDVDVVCAQTYVAPIDLFSRAFALGWTYLPRSDQGKVFQPKKFYANTIAFRTEMFRKVGGFPALGPKRTRGAASLLREELARLGSAVWENQNAAVDHPPPSSFRHLAIRGIAHGRDHYMKRQDDRHLAGLVRSVGLAAGRLGQACYRTLRHGRQVGLSLWEVPGVITITSMYYACFALGGVLTHLSPEMMDAVSASETRGVQAMPDHYLAICAIMRDEGPYLAEWIAFHRLVGVERFYLYDNGSTDDSADVLAPYRADGTVDVRSWPVPYHLGAPRQAYSDCLARVRGQVRWLACIDLDEFLFAPREWTLPAVLHAYEEFPGVVVRWQVYGSSGHERAARTPVIARFERRARSDWIRNRRVKSIVDPMRAEAAVNSHHFRYREGELAVDETRTRVALRPRPRFKKQLRPLYRLLGPALRLTDPYAATNITSTTVSVEHLRINHYPIKSREEFQRKAQLKREKKRYQSLDYFAYHDRNEVLDPILARYLPHLGLGSGS